MTTAEKILCFFIVVLGILCVVLGVQKSQMDVEIGAAEYALNELHEAQIELYDTQIDTLFELITTLQTERDSLRNAKAKIKIVTIHEIDSIRALPFSGKRVFFTREITRLDSIRTRYLSSGHSTGL